MHKNSKALHASGGIRAEKKVQNIGRKNKQQQHQGALLQQQHQGALLQQQQQQNKKQHQQQQQQNRKQKQQSQLGPSFLLPYNQEWPPIQKFHNDLIVEEIQSVLGEKLCDQKLLAKKRKLEKKYASADPTEIDRMLKDIAKKWDREEFEIDSLVSSLRDETKIDSVGKYFLFGINIITKHLERNGSLDLLLVCRSAQPSLMTQHLLCQSLVADIPACAITDLSPTVSKLFAFNSALAIGFKKVENNPFQDLIEFIKDKIPTYDESPWVKLWRKNDNNKEDMGAAPDTSKDTETGEGVENIDTNFSNAQDEEFKKSRKRTHEDVKFLDLNIKWKEINRKTKKKKR